jgi:hypothetical protein
MFAQTQQGKITPVTSQRVTQTWNPWRMRLATGGGLLVGMLIFFFGGIWDIQWHQNVGRDQTFTPPHDFILGGITICGVVALAGIIVETLRASEARVAAPGIPFAGILRGSLGAYIAGFAALACAIAFPLDNYWHSINGIDVSLWAPFHVMFIGGMALVGLGASALFADTAQALVAHPAGQRPGALARLAQVGVFLAFGTSMATLLVLLSPALGAQGFIRSGGSILSLYPLLLGLSGLVLLFAATTRLSWPGLATGIVAVMLVERVLVAFAVPPAMALLIQIQHQTVLPRATSTVVGVLGLSPFFLVIAPALDALLWLGRRRGWSPRAMRWGAVGAATVAVFLAAAVQLLLTRRALAHSVLAAHFAIVPSLVLGILGAIAGGWLGIAIGRAITPATQPQATPRPWRPWWQTGLAAASVLTLGITLYSLVQIVFAASFHSDVAARVIPVTAGAYQVNLAIYADPIEAGYAQAFTLSSSGGAVPQGYSILALPAQGVKATPITADIGTVDGHGQASGTVYITVRGDWTLLLTVTGASGQAVAAVPIAAVAPPAIPPAVAWAIGLIPLDGVLIFTGVAAWQHRKDDEETSGID